MYTVQVRLDGDGLTVRMAEVTEWFEIQGRKRGAFQYKLAPEHVSIAD